MRILVITDAYPPETRSSSQLMGELAEGLQERGHEVFVVTSVPAEPNLPKGIKAEAGVAKENGVTVIRTKVLPHHNVNFILKGISWLALPYLFFLQVRKHVEGKLDIAWVHSPPLPLTIAANLVKKFCGAKFFLNLQDFFPQNAVDLGVLKNRLLVRFFEWMERKAYRDADVIVTPSIAHRDFAHKERGVPMGKINVVPHWIDLKSFEAAKRTGKFRKMYGLEEKFIFVFGGILGPSQGLDIFIRIAEKLKKYKDLCFLFVGEGSEKERLINLTKSLGLNNVVFKPFVSKEEYPWLLKDADVGILSLTSANTTPAVPAKLMGYLAAGLPVLAFLHKESDGIRIVNDAECGLAAVSDDEENMARLTEKIYLEKEKLKIYGENGFKYALAHFTKDVCLDKLEKLF